LKRADCGLEVVGCHCLIISRWRSFVIPIVLNTARERAG
jgi:hypothetical protein